MPGSADRKQRTRLLNVDLDLWAQSGLPELYEAMKSDVIQLTIDVDGGFMALELSRVQPDTIDEAFNLYREIVVNLDEAERLLWAACDQRVLDIGIEVGTETYSEAFDLSSEALAAALELEAEVRVTVYRPPIEPEQ
jgi:hypothetical protein